MVYEVTGDGPAEIVYTEKLGESPKRVSNAELPWKFTTTMESAAFIVGHRRSAPAPTTGEISCRATVDGEEVAAEAPARAASPRATCTNDGRST